MSTGKRLKLFLKEKGISQTSVAERIGMKMTAFNAILNGHAHLKADTLEQVCQVIGVSPGVFFAHNFQENGKI